MKKLIIALLGSFIFVSGFAIANSTPYDSYCLEAMGNLTFVKKPLQVVDPAGGWILTWDGSSIYRQSDVKVLGIQLGSSKQEIWSQKKFKDTGDGSIGSAPLLQVRNAQHYFINKSLFELGSTPLTSQNAKSLDEALASCEGVSSRTTSDGEPKGELSPKNGGDVARTLRTKIRDGFSNLFNETPSGPKASAVQ